MTLSPKIMVAAALWLASAVVVAQTCKTDSIPATTPTGRFIVNGDGTVTDTKTQLMWNNAARDKAAPTVAQAG